MTDQMTATCRCGAVRITVRGAPLSTGICHCTGCQAMTSSAFSVGALYLQDAVDIAGELVPAGLKGAQNHLACAECLSWVVTKFAAMGPIVNVHSTQLAALSDRPPFIETWTDEKLSWVESGATHSFAGFPAEADFPALLAEYAGQIAG